MTVRLTPPAAVGNEDADDAAQVLAVASDDAMLVELQRLRDELALERAERMQLALELQVERARRDILVDTPAIVDRRRSDRSVSGVWHWHRRLLGGRAFTSLGGLYRRVLPEREASAAAPWALARWEIGVLLLIVAVAAVVRFTDLADIPPGVQGDEAAIAIEGRRVREEGWIGPYSPIAAGMPTGVIYAVSGAQRLFGDSIHSVRLVAAFFGTLTVPLLYLLMRRSFGRYAAVAGAGFLAVTGWHIHYSRMGFPNIDWPFFVTAGLLALVEASRSASRWWWAGAGALLGLGVYTYSSHMVFLALIAAHLGLTLLGLPAILLGMAVLLSVASPGVLSTLLIAIAVAALLVSPFSPRSRGRFGGAVVFAAVLVVVALPMIRYAADERNNYFGYGERLSLTNSEEWAARSGTGERVTFLAGRYVDYWDRLCCHPRFDGVDATGTVPLVPLSMLLLAFAGMGFALWRGHRLLATVGALTVLAVPLTSVLSVDFALRRTLILTVFLAMFAGVAMVEAVRYGWRWRYGRYAVLPLVGLLAVVSVRQNLDDYFNGTVTSSQIRWVDAVEMVAASRYAATLPDGSYVYFLTERWPFSHEIRRYFAPDAAGEDRSEDFGEYRLPYDPENGRPVYVLVGRYEDDLTRLQARYPGGDVVSRGPEENPDFIAYLPPWPPSASPAPTSVPAVGTPGTEEGRG